ncbi:MAG: T9SS type A sorting domain-containing protein, partial [Paludibacteraceae bacterium]|nr:T9SS type A sorting domain-containing protein [Paludibacteraceae bacterium]MBR6493242.1 T9SS type A sorting domain-containing protein [Paludibacteraceae bacterium]
TRTIEIPHMRQYACLTLRFQVTKPDDADDVLTEQITQVPIVVTTSISSNDTLFTYVVKNDETHTPIIDASIERCKTCNVIIRNGGILTKSADGTANDADTLYNVKIYPGGKLIIPAKSGSDRYTYTLNSLSIRREEDILSWVNIKDTLKIVQPNGVYFDLRIDPSNWHYITLPYDCDLDKVTFSDGTKAVLGTDYIVGWYDGAYRAAHKDGGWTNVEAGATLKKGLGYIISLPGDGTVKRELRFPMANEVVAKEKTNKTIQGLYAYGGDQDIETLRPNHRGWNMIGNPYLYTYHTDIMGSPLATGYLVPDSTVTPWDGTMVIKKGTSGLRYIVEPIDNGWSGYRQVTLDNMNPFTAYFVQIGTKTDGSEDPTAEQGVNFVASSINRSAAPRRMMAAEEDNHPVWYGVELIAPNNQKDNTTLLISNKFTDGYDMMDDLVKQRGDYYNYYPYPVLASRNNEGEMAFNALPDVSAAVVGVPLNYYAYAAGTYTFATDSRFDLEEVKSALLFDATQNEYYDLLESNHSFSLAKGNNTNRFKLFVTVERKKPQIPTDVDNILTDGKLSLIAIDKTLVLSGLTDAASIYVYDMSGKLIKGERTSGNGIWRATVPAQGVYFVRVNGADGQQTLRTIVK